MSKKNIQPFLKYLDNKFDQLDQVKSLLPQGATRLVEPFVGSGSVFLNTSYREYLLCDVNKDLINTFKLLAAYQEDFIVSCKRYFVEANNNSDSYNRYRKIFNEICLGAASVEQRIKKASLFVYLNRHGFRGMVRFNSKGEFNVPYGSYESPYFPEAEMLAFVEKINQCELAEFRVADFRETLNRAKDGDVVYCDPPDVPLSASSNFTKHCDESFTWHDRVELLGLCKKLRKEQNIASVISDHDTAEIVKLYGGDITKMIRSFVQQSISDKTRGVKPELMIIT
jgi:DNA adenine methylase